MAMYEDYEDLVEWLRECTAEQNGEKTLWCQAADAIDNLLYICKHQAEELRNIPKWIPASERLPNCNGCYLVWRPHFFGGEIGMPSICYFDGTNTWHDSYGVDFTRILHPEDVTHWMQLPEPPNEE